MALPERLYYPLDMAAKEAGCETRDLLHFAAIGQLEICTRLKTADSGNTNFLAFPPAWMLKKAPNVHQYGPREEAVFLFFLHSPEGLGQVRFCRYPNDIITAESFDAFFSIGFSVFQQIEFARDLVEVEIGRSYVTMPRGNKFYARIDREEKEREMDENLGAKENGNCPYFVMDIQRPIPFSSLVITAKELALLKSGGEKIPEQATQDPPRVHGNARRFSSTREQILTAALYCKANFPDACSDYTRWAETIDEKAPLFWTETGAPPLARGVIERLLSDAHKAPADVE